MQTKKAATRERLPVIDIRLLFLFYIFQSALASVSFKINVAFDIVQRKIFALYVVADIIHVFINRFMTMTSLSLL